MEKLRMYSPVKKEEEKEPLKTPLLTIRGKFLSAVAETGEILANLQNLSAGIMISDEYVPGARHCLAEKGFRTDWAEWAGDGSFVRLLEDVEG